MLHASLKKLIFFSFESIKECLTPCLNQLPDLIVLLAYQSWSCLHKFKYSAISIGQSQDSRWSMLLSTIISFGKIKN